MKRPLAALLVALVTSFAAPALARQPRCPLDLNVCLGEFARMREAPWVGVLLHPVDHRTVVQVAPDGPAARAGLRVGDVVVGIEGRPPAEGRRLLAGRAGWRTGAEVHYRIRRDQRELDVSLRLGKISEEQLAQMIGEHMIESHLAYAGAGPHTN